MGTGRASFGLTGRRNGSGTSVSTTFVAKIGAVMTEIMANKANHEILVWSK
jgi:hypothetical protein